MDSFPFSQHKLLKLPERRQHKWIKRWLREIYTAVLNREMSVASWTLFCNHYRKIREWQGDEPPLFPVFGDQKNRLEFVADCFHFHQQKMGLGLREGDFLPRVMTGDALGGEEWAPTVFYRVALDNFRSAFNVGSVFRTTDAAGFESLILGGRTPNATHNQVRKAAMGCLDWIPYTEAPDLAAVLRDSEYPVIGVETVENAADYQTFEWPERAVLVLGNEEYGLSTDVMAECDQFVKIPMHGRKNSVNVSNAYAILAFHIHSCLHPEKGVVC